MPPLKRGRRCDVIAPLLFVLALIGAAAGASSSAQAQGRPQVCFYEHTHFQGRAYCIRVGERVDFVGPAPTTSSRRCASRAAPRRSCASMPISAAAARRCITASRTSCAWASTTWSRRSPHAGTTTAAVMADRPIAAGTGPGTIGMAVATGTGAGMGTGALGDRRRYATAARSLLLRARPLSRPAATARRSAAAVAVGGPRDTTTSSLRCRCRAASWSRSAATAISKARARAFAGMSTSSAAAGTIRSRRSARISTHCA